MSGSPQFDIDAGSNDATISKGQPPASTKVTEPTKREYDVLRKLSGGLVESRGGLHPAGAKTITDMIAKGWIEETPFGAGDRLGYRITPTGGRVYVAGRASKPRRPPRLKTLRPRLGNVLSRVPTD